MAETPEQPTQDLTWATIGTKTEASGAKKNQGYVANDVPPYDEWNWWRNAEGLLFDWIRERLGKSYDTLEGPDGAAGLASPGERVYLLKDVPPSIVCTPNAGAEDTRTQKSTLGTTAGYFVEALCADGARIIFVDADNGGNGDVQCYTAESDGTAGTLVWSHSHGEDYPIGACTDGLWTVIWYGGTLAAPSGDAITVFKNSTSDGPYGAESGTAGIACCVIEYQSTIDFLVWYCFQGVGNPIRTFDAVSGVTTVTTPAGFATLALAVTPEALFALQFDNVDSWRIAAYRKTALGTGLAGGPVVICSQSDGAGHGDPTAGGALATDGRLVFALVPPLAGGQAFVAAFPAHTTSQLSPATTAITATPLWRTPVANATGDLDRNYTRLTCDDRYVYGTAKNTTFILDKESGAIVQSNVTGAANTAPRGLDFGPEWLWTAGSSLDGGTGGHKGVFSRGTGRSSSRWVMLPDIDTNPNSTRRRFKKVLAPENLHF